VWTKTFLFLLFLFSLFVFDPKPAGACESCVIPNLGRRTGFEKETLAKPWFFDFTFEQQNWDERPALEAHELHEEGHHIHNKTHEEFYHFTLGANPSEKVTFFAEIPYVVRGLTEVEDHDRVGEKEVSEGIGDLNCFLTYRFLRQGENYLGAVGGVKFPTGETKELNSQKVRFEPELQPGTGSYDYPFGAVYQLRVNSFVFRGNAVYVIKTQGDQDFEWGDLFSTSLFIDYIIHSGNNAETKIGLDLNFQHEGKQSHHGSKINDSGGTTLFLGPALTIKAGDHVWIFVNFLFPVHQNLGGVHQELDFVWSAGAKVNW
jgi:hypothetical protein